MMYFNNDIKINKFKNESDFKSCLTCLLRADSAQRWTNDLTSKNELFTLGDPTDTGVFRFKLDTRKSIKENFYKQWKQEINHLYFSVVECPRDDIFEWNENMHKEMQKIIKDMMCKHYYPILIIVHNDQPRDFCHFHMVLDYIDPDQ